MATGRRYILNLGGVNKRRMRLNYKSDTFTCLLDFSHGISRIFESKVKLHVAIGLKLNRPISLAPGKDK